MVTELINNGMITDAIAQLKDRALKYPNENFIDRIEAIATDFKYMSDFMLQGMQDEHRGELYSAMQQKLHDIDYDLEVRKNMWDRLEVMPYKKIFTHPDFSAEMLQAILIEPTDAKEHHIRLTNIFMALYASLHWNDTESLLWSTFLSDKEVNPIDAATLVTAITLNVLEYYNAPKADCIKRIYQHSTSQLVRQRALVALVLLGEEVSIETHMQIAACANADQDSNEIRQNIMPNIIKNQPLKMVNGKWKVDEDGENTSGEYDPEADKREEESIEAMEESVNKMLKMQKKGSDIFFEGFSQMKRFPFFNKLINWFMPYYPEHPDIQYVMSSIGNSSFIETVMKRGPFCESDKYSFIIAMSSVLQQLPESVRTLMEGGDLGPIGMRGEDADMDDPAFIRLQYLQDLYRFFRLSNIGIKPRNPFTHLDDILEGFINTTTHSDTQDTDYTTLYSYYANWKLKKGEYDTALEYYAKCLKARPNSISIMRGMARAYYAVGDYEKSASYFDALITLNPDNLNNRLNYAKAMTKAGKPEEVLNGLYKLDFENPDNVSIQDTLGWALLYAGKAAEAEQYCHDVIAKAYALLFNNKPREATESLKGYSAHQIKENMDADAQLLRKYGIGEAEAAIILSAIPPSSGQ